MRTITLPLALLAATLAVSFAAQAQEHSAANSTPAPSTVAAETKTHAPIRPEFSPRIEGERRFHQNCGRCHLAPQKYPPRMMATILRHMRVRATITDEDAKIILQYMTE
ncbi:MAG TPA: cytochrome c [Candidatus Cybelea sp.]|nr:cytochrome c [Candidatus Cybelea sp.]